MPTVMNGVSLNALTTVDTWSALSLFANGEQGVWYDPSDMSTMFQDASGNTPVTTVEQPVGLILDKSKNLALGSETVINGDCSSSTGWISGGAGWTITGGQLVMTAAASSGVVYQQYADGRLTAGKTYKVTFDIVSVSVGSARIELWGAATASGVSFSTTGTKTCYIVAPSAPIGMQFTVSGPFTGTIDNISVREVLGNHANQSTAASRPVLSARVNLLTQTENFSSADWVPYNVSKTAGSLTLTGTSGGASQPKALTTGVPYRFECQIKKGTNNFAYLNIQGSSVYATAVFDVNSGVPGETKFSGAGFAVSSLSVSGPDADGYYTCGATFTPGNASVAIVGFAAAATGNTFDAFGNPTGCTNGNTLLVRKADLRVTNVGVGLPAYQRVGAAVSGTSGTISPPVAAVTGVPDYDIAGFPLYLKFDGVDDSLATSSIDFTATNKMSVFAGVRKLSDANLGTVVSLGGNSSTSGLFQVFAPRTTPGTYGWRAFNTVASAQDVNSTSNYAAPDTAILTGLFNGSAASNEQILGRRNATQVAIGASGLGSFVNQPLYVGIRFTDLPLNGNLYSLILRGALSNSSQIENAENYINSKTKAY